VRRMSLLAGVLAAGLALASCGGSNDPEPPAGGGATTSAGAPTGGGGQAEAKVGLVFDTTGRGDKSFNDAAAAGAEKAKAELGVTVDERTPNASATDRADLLRQLADAGNNPIIGVGFLFQEDITKVAKEYPGTTFAIIDGVIEADNVVSLVFAEEQGSYLVGAAAALKSKTGNVGFIGGVQTPLLQKFEAGFAAGVKKVKPAATVQVKYLTQPPDFTGFSAPDKGAAAAKGMYDGGADIIYAAAGGSGKGVFDVAVAEGPAALAIGVDSDQYNLVSPAQKPKILTSMLKRVDVAVYDFITSFTEGQAKGGSTRTFDLKADGVGYSTSGGQVEDIKAQLDDLRQQIIEGKITVPAKP
jgi:basic membrane protein A